MKSSLANVVNLAAELVLEARLLDEAIDGLTSNIETGNEFDPVRKQADRVIEQARDLDQKLEEVRKAMRTDTGSDGLHGVRVTPRARRRSHSGAGPPRATRWTGSWAMFVWVY
jgi:hypothetical protein